MTNLVISNQAISTHNGLFSLNDLHKVSGNDKNHQPSNFMANKQTQALIAELENENQIAYDTVIGKGKKQGTYACRELVYAYAMWISAKFNLEVIRAFDNLNTGAIPCLPKKTNAHQRQALVTACDKLAVGNTLRSDIYKMVGNQFGVDDIQSIPMHQLADATAFVYEILLAKSAQPNHNAHSEHNAFWRTVGVLEYTRLADEMRAMEIALKDLANRFYKLNNSKGLIYDALDQQRITNQTSQRTQALALIYLT